MGPFYQGWKENEFENSFRTYFYFQMCELLVEKILTSYPNALTIGDALRRVIEAISAGLLLSCKEMLIEILSLKDQLVTRRATDGGCICNRPVRLFSISKSP